jgi:elongation factor P
MDLETYEQFTMPLQGLEDKKLFLREGDTVQLSFWDERPIDILLPYKIVLKVSQAEAGLKGDTVSGATKPVTMETGLVVRVPLFIKTGDKILVNTETREYVERVN